MKKMLRTYLCFTLLFLNGCKTNTATADGHYSGCTFVVESDDHYNIGFEIHYSDEDTIEWNYALASQISQLMHDLDDGSSANLIENREYCSDASRTNVQIQRFALSIPHSEHDEMINRLKTFSFQLTMHSKKNDQQYFSMITLPIIDLSM